MDIHPIRSGEGEQALDESLLTTVRAVALLALAIFTVSLFLPGVRVVKGGPVEGWFLGFAGPMGVIMGEFRWFANAFFAFALCNAFFSRRASFWAIASCCAGIALAAWCAVKPPDLPADGGIDHTEFAYGGYVWIFAQVVLLGALLMKIGIEDPAPPRRAKPRRSR